VLTTIITSTVAALVSLSVLFLTRRSETIKHLQSLRTAAYVDFIRGVAALAAVREPALAELFHQEPSQPKEYFLKEWEARLLVADAKSRIAIYGSKPVVSALADFLRGGVVLDSPERQKAFTAVCQVMRADSRPGPDAATDDDVHFLLFGSDIKSETSPALSHEHRDESHTGKRLAAKQGKGMR
jgi:hypothetical protein